MAGAVVFLASPAAGFANGVTLPVDGGDLAVRAWPPGPLARHRRCFRCSASLSASSMIVRVGLAIPPFGKTLLPAT